MHNNNIWMEINFTKKNVKLLKKKGIYLQEVANEII